MDACWDSPPGTPAQINIQYTLLQWMSFVLLLPFLSFFFFTTRVCSSGQSAEGVWETADISDDRMEALECLEFRTRRERWRVIQKTWAEEDGGVGKRGVLRARPFSMKAGTQAWTGLDYLTLSRVSLHSVLLIKKSQTRLESQLVRVTKLSCQFDTSERHLRGGNLNREATSTRAPYRHTYRKVFKLVIDVGGPSPPLAWWSWVL